MAEATTWLRPPRSCPTADRQAADMASRYGAAAWALDGRVYLTDREWARLTIAVLTDRRLSGSVRGWYLYGNGNVVVLPTCDRCGVELYLHGGTLAGQACDLQAAIDDLRTAFVVGMIGANLPRRPWPAVEGPLITVKRLLYWLGMRPKMGSPWGSPSLAYVYGAYDDAVIRWRAEVRG